MSKGDGSSGGAAAGQEVAGTVAEQTGQVAQQAGVQAKAMVGTAAEQARQVGGEAAARAGDLLGETKAQARRQAESQTQQLAESLGRLRDQGRALAAGRPEQAGSLPDIAQQVVGRLDQVVERIDRGGVDGIVDDVQRFARRRPGVFLLGAAALGFAVGRMVRAGAVQHATGQDGQSELRDRSGQLTPPADWNEVEPLVPVDVPPVPSAVPPMSPSPTAEL
jgi:hypothetical protein